MTDHRNLLLTASDKVNNACSILGSACEILYKLRDITEPFSALSEENASIRLATVLQAVDALFTTSASFKGIEEYGNQVEESPEGQSLKALLKNFGPIFIRDTIPLPVPPVNITLYTISCISDGKYHIYYRWYGEKEEGHWTSEIRHGSWFYDRAIVDDIVDKLLKDGHEYNSLCILPVSLTPIFEKAILCTKTK